MIKQRTYKCSVCGSETSTYNLTHDAYYCEKCDTWLEEKCSDLECTFCRNRPAKPSQLIVVDSLEVSE